MANAAGLDWGNLGFQYRPTNAYVRADFADGRWSAPALQTDPYVSMHIAANCLHYGQTCFEGLKAFSTRDGVVLFRPEMNARRMAYSAQHICMEPVPEDLFLKACMLAVRANREFVPPHGTGASLYVRPVLFATEPMVGLKASDSFTFLVLVTPVGPYYKDGFSPVAALILDNYDRAAPQGTGRAKIGGNYAAGFLPARVAKERGYPIVLFTDPATHTMVDEFGTSNFFGITRDGRYQTPTSSSILASITNDSLQQLARDFGMPVDAAPIPVAELDRFAEVGACGTAAVITPISEVHHSDRIHRFGAPERAGETLTRLYNELQGIQYGEAPDRHRWLTVLAED